MHAAPEHAKRTVPVYVPHDWLTVCRLARKKKPYKFMSLQHGDFINFKAMHACLSYNFSVINWMKLNWIRLQKSCEQLLVMHKENYEDNFSIVPSKRTRNSVNLSAVMRAENIYTSQLHRSSSKKTDLMTLCKNGTIPTCYHTFYEKLPSIDEQDDDDSYNEEED